LNTLLDASIALSIYDNIYSCRVGRVTLAFIHIQIGNKTFGRGIDVLTNAINLSVAV